jgi:hypothetical protein
MCCRLSGTFAAAAVAMLLGAGVLAAQSVGGGGNNAGGDNTAEGSILGPDSAEVVVGTGGRPGGSGGTGAGGGGGGSDITCSLGWPTGPGGFADPATLDVLTGLHEESGPVTVVQTCFDAEGAVISSEVIEWSPVEGGAGPVLVDPAVLAQMARERMSWPSPAIATSPALDHGTYAQLSTFFHVSNWEAVTSPPATAGAAWATVTATPVSQSWVIQDTYRGTSETITCDGAGALYDESRPYEAQLPAPCGWTPAHSSAGQTRTSPHTGEPCFPSSVTLAWDVSWQSNVAPGGPLGEGTSTTSVCLVVAELQATVVEYPGVG